MSMLTLNQKSKARGRNGLFVPMTVDVTGYAAPDGPRVHINVLSKSPHTRNAPIALTLSLEDAQTLVNGLREALVEAKGDDPDALAYREKARELYQDEGSIEIDENAEVSESDEGAYVQAWVYVSAEDADLSCECAQCEETAKLSEMESTPCGSMHEDCIEDHGKECEVCKKEFC